MYDTTQGRKIMSEWLARAYTNIVQAASRRMHLVKNHVCELHRDLWETRGVERCRTLIGRSLASTSSWPSLPFARDFADRPICVPECSTRQSVYILWCIFKGLRIIYRPEIYPEKRIKWVISGLSNSRGVGVLYEYLNFRVHSIHESTPEAPKV